MHSFIHSFIHTFTTTITITINITITIIIQSFILVQLGKNQSISYSSIPSSTDPRIKRS